MNNSEKIKGALFAIKQKFSESVPTVNSLSDEQKAWLQMKVQTVADGVVSSDTIAELQKIRNRLVHSTEDLPDSELQKIVSFVFENMSEIENLVGKEA